MQFFCQFQDVHPFPLQTEAWVKRYVGTKYYAASNECTMAGAAVKTFLCLAHICSTLFATVDVDRSACRFASDCPIMSEVQEADQFVRVKNTKFCNFVNVSEVPRYHYAKFCVVWMVNLQSDWLKSKKKRVCVSVIVRLRCENSIIREPFCLHYIPTYLGAIGMPVGNGRASNLAWTEMRGRYVHPTL